MPRLQRMFRLEQPAQVAGKGKGKLVATLISHTPAHEVSATVAPFRAWRSLQMFIAGGTDKGHHSGADYGDFEGRMQQA